ncbi:MAG: hypothetical protein KAJ07_04585 [Planctomycetes bacterium]|nr:hypothetical protein [Planctomycetota bacterium]
MAKIIADIDILIRYRGGAVVDVRQVSEDDKSVFDFGDALDLLDPAGKSDADKLVKKVIKALEK